MNETKSLNFGEGWKLLRQRLLWSTVFHPTNGVVPEINLQPKGSVADETNKGM